MGVNFLGSASFLSAALIFSKGNTDDEFVRVVLTVGDVKRVLVIIHIM